MWRELTLWRKVQTDPLSLWRNSLPLPLLTSLCGSLSPYKDPGITFERPSGHSGKSVPAPSSINVWDDWIHGGWSTKYSGTDDQQKGELDWKQSLLKFPSPQSFWDWLLASKEWVELRQSLLHAIVRSHARLQCVCPAWCIGGRRIGWDATLMIHLWPDGSNAIVQGVFISDI